MKKIALLGDTSDHGGTIISTRAVKTYVEGKLVVCEEAYHSCPQEGHGTTKIISTSDNVYVEGGKIIRDGDQCGCGAKIISSSQKSYA